MPIPRSQLRMTAEELDGFLGTERTLRLAVVGGDGWPHVVPLWFVWVDGRFYVNNLERSKRTRLLRAGARAALTVDAGEVYDELRGVSCAVEQRFLDPEVTEPYRLAHARKYVGSDEPMPLMRSHNWLELTPVGELVSWDFRKIGA